MKRLLIAISLMFVLGIVVPAFAADTFVTERVNVTNKLEEVTIMVVDDGDATIDAYSIKGGLAGYLMNMITDPGTPAPTDNYDITITQGGLDILGGYGADRDTANTEDIRSSGFSLATVNGPATLNITNNSQNGMKLIIRLFIAK